jgi:hypothetical protein
MAIDSKKGISSKLVQQEIARRSLNLKRAEEAPKFKLEDYCFDKQLEFIKDPAKFKTAVCSRRSGKSVSCSADLMHTALTQEGDCAYITLNRITAKRIIWRELMNIDKNFKLGCEFDNTELTVTFPNGNKIYVTAAKDESDGEKLRGIALRKIYIDESQSFRGFIEGLVDDVLIPTLTDYDGSLILIGTPGPVPAGYFYNASHSKGWSQHRWTMEDNPHILRKSGKPAPQIIKEVCERRGVSITDPSIRREYFGEWIKDENSLVFKFNSQLNTFRVLPEGKWNYIFGIDIGYKDADAISVLAYDHKQDCCYLVEELITRKQDITALALQIKELQARYKPIKMIMDAGALGKKIQEEIRNRHGLPVEAAEKERKLEYIALMNGDLRTGKIKAFEGSRFAEDCDMVVWDWDDPVRPKISDKYHSDSCDSTLYAWREAKHYFEKEAEIKYAPNSDAWMNHLEEEEAEKMELKSKGLEDNWGVDQEDLDDVFEGYGDELNDLD